MQSRAVTLPALLLVSKGPAPSEIYTLSLHDALPIYSSEGELTHVLVQALFPENRPGVETVRSEEHTSELQSLRQLVCRLLLEKNNGSEGHEQIAVIVTAVPGPVDRDAGLR